ncbi:hypothetical protein GSI_02681 [Ganoderma sinense ZZ0214-1]|uniref:Uncharacterized protein n=1 Tax=Ganoderma sinense ZZ0214-1 TaxID=1077348 RepID=A0A2G8SM96_9APHY|nr:hypothetical protein GSI_02681 [Ganoderma sinense ZZ0214-1]
MPLDTSVAFDSGSYPGEVNGIALDLVRTYPYAARNAMVELSLLFLSFAVLTILTATAIYFVLHRGSLSHTNARVLLLSTVLLYLSTGTNMAALIWNSSTWNHVAMKATDGFFSASYDGQQEITEFQDAVRKQSWMMTVSTVINFIIADAIVWWRACAIWQNKILNCVGPLLVTLTLSGTAFTYVSVLLSLVTNVAATSLIAYKAWQHRQLVKTYFHAAGPKSRVLKALGMLVESGVAYCALLVLVIVYGVEPAASPDNPARVWFNQVVAYFTQGCLAPLMAIFPTVVIVLVALKLSPIDNGGLSGVQSDAAARLESGSMSDTVVFRHSTFLSSHGMGAEASVGRPPVPA